MKFEKADDLKFTISKHDANRAVLSAMQVNDAYKPIILNKEDLKAWRNCAYRYGAESNKVFSVKKAVYKSSKPKNVREQYYVVRIA